MTEEQAIKGKKIIDQIQQLQKQLSDIEVYATHIEEQMRQNEDKGIELSMSRSWSVIHNARVNGNNFLQFLNCEKSRIKLGIKSLKEELDNI